MAQSLLATDGYKFSMAEAGWPLRTEAFYYSHRKGGPQVLPVDVPAFVRSLLPRPADDDYRYLAQQIVDAFPNDSAPAYLLRDRDQVFGEQFRHRVKAWRLPNCSRRRRARGRPVPRQYSVRRPSA
jgi:hypothetical protein